MATTATVAAAGDESIWVIAGEIHSGSQVTGSLSVARIAYDGSLLARWPLEPFVDSHFTFLTQLDLVTSSNGDVVVLDGWRGRIGRYSPAGELLAQWSLPDFDGGPGSTARSVIDGGPNDTVLLVQSLDATESPPARLTIFDAGGAVLNSWAIEEELPSHMSWSHYSLTVTPDERVLVGIAHGSDTYRRSIRAYMLDGRQVGSWQVPSASPEWLADTSEGGPMLANMESLPDGRLVIDDRAQRGTNMTSGLRVYGPAREDAWHGAFYAEPFMPGHPAASVVYPGGPLDLDWGPAPPTDGLPSDGFAVRLHRLVQVPVGTHRFTVAAHGGIRLWVGTRLLIDRWDAESVSETAEAFLRPGQYDIQLDFTDPNGAASLHFDWQPGSPGSRLFMPRVEFTPGSTRSPSAIGRNFAQRETVTRGP
jgi:hypothetical protein